MNSMWVINGQTVDGMWRIQDATSERVGMDFLLNPVALVTLRKDAEEICKLHNEVE